jgi:endonuclease YncB( thermonuclease family)
MVKRIIVSLFIALIAVSAAYAQRFPVKVIGVSDGDTFTVINRDNLQLKIRVYGIDAPEKNQAYGNKSKQALSALIFGKNIEIDVQSQEKWGRYVAKVYTPDGQDVALLMLQSGMAWHYTRFDQTPSYAKAQETAKKAGKGLWADKSPVAPWDFRHN